MQWMQGYKKDETIVFVVIVSYMFSIWQTLTNLVVLAIFWKWQSADIFQEFILQWQIQTFR